MKTPYGNEIQGYDLERTLCDMLRGRQDVDVQMLHPAMQQYVKNDSKNIQKLLEYASALGVERKMRTYLEVLL